ncbi:MAG: tRNA (adenosine(37)-N6)-threonylcarbamoyltransferase complex transferase subunit TsaD [Minisyncoccia bacterium]|jgi:N6-L-threonylcarbamoyladenine synthase
MNILAIETSCDETGIALLEASGTARAPRVRAVENLVTTQIPVHREFGGVVPNLAKREHLKNLPILFAQLRARHPRLKFDLITVTVGPGLEPALWTGITFAQSLAKEYGVPLVGANHLEGHLYSFLLSQKKSRARDLQKNIFPAIALIVSGGHTILLKLDSFSRWKRLGETRDDAAGEAFDKVARLLGLRYPGGPEIERLARAGNPHAIAFPRPMLHEKNYDFSFSGLKTSVLYYLRDHGLDKKISASAKADIAASFQEAALDVLVKKTIRAARESGARSVMLSGGVAANKALRARLAREAKKIGCTFFVPDFKYNLDNGAMIGIAGYMAYLRKKRYKLEARGDMEI